VAVTIALLVLTDNKHSASYVFGHVSDGSGWGSRGFSYLIGYLSVAWTMTDYDATVRRLDIPRRRHASILTLYRQAHISEELHNAAVSGPVAIFQAVLVTWVSFSREGVMTAVT
jgi:hypothetical protein